MMLLQLPLLMTVQCVLNFLLRRVTSKGTTLSLKRHMLFANWKTCWRLKKPFCGKALLSVLHVDLLEVGQRGSDGCQKSGRLGSGRSNLAAVAKRYPQTAYAGFVTCLQAEW